MKKNIFITGASGFIGTHLVELALQKGFEVYAMVRKNSDISNLMGAKLVYGELNNYDDLLQIFSAFKEKQLELDHIIHAAALTKSNLKQHIFETNYYGTDKLIKCLKALNYFPKKIIFISSLAACGPAKANEQINLSDNNPVTAYGESKLKAEQLIKKSGIPYIIIRPTAVYGPGEKALYSLFKIINRNINPILGSRDQELTFIYVKDLAELILSTTSSIITNETYFATDGNVYDKYAFATGVSKALNKKTLQLKIPLSLFKMISFISHYSNAMLGKGSTISLDKYKELTAESWNCDMNKTLNDFKFSPNYDLQKGIEETTLWYKQNKWIK